LADGAVSETLLSLYRISVQMSEVIYRHVSKQFAYQACFMLHFRMKLLLIKVSYIFKILSPNFLCLGGKGPGKTVLCFASA